MLKQVTMHPRGVLDSQTLVFVAEMGTEPQLDEPTKGVKRPHFAAAEP